jgi:hypothetical protein
MNPPGVESLDKKLKKTLAVAAKSPLSPAQRNKLATQVKTLVSDVASLGISSAVDDIGNFFLSRERLLELGQRAPFPVQRFMELGRAGFGVTLEFGVADSPEAFAELPAAILLEQISSPVALSKVAASRKGLVADALKIIQEKPELPLNLAGMRWVLAKAKFSSLLPLVPTLFADHGHDLDSDSIATLRLAFLARDKTAKGILEILRLIAKEELSDQVLVDAFTRSPETAVVFVRLLPKLLPKPLGEQALTIFHKWLSARPQISIRTRGMVSGALLALCGALLQKMKRRPNEDAALTLVVDFARQLSLEIGADVGGYWGVFPLGEKRELASGGDISSEGARLLVESLQKLQDDRYEPTSVFRALARNLGLTEMDELGMSVKYDPKKHHDTVGGLLREQSAVVVRSGWRYKDSVLLKTEVKPQTDYA